MNEARWSQILDHTRLQSNDSIASLQSWAEVLQQAAYAPYGVCLLPQWLAWAKTQLRSDVQIVTVANFPSGQMAINDVLVSVEQHLQVGFDELDVVIPYHDVLAGCYQTTKQLIQSIKSMVGARPVKAIIELAALAEPSVIQKTSMYVIEAGADFIKTSTGTIPYVITQADIALLLSCIKQADRLVGLKLSGGIRSIEQAQCYHQWITAIMGPQFIQPHTFRIGSSQLFSAMAGYNHAIV